MMRYIPGTDIDGFRKAALVATGTKGGLTSDPDRHAQSVYKHELLRQYLPRFIAMSSSGAAASDRSATVVDGFAGPGSYATGAPGSSLLMLRSAESLSASVHTTLWFVERDPDTFAHLQSTMLAAGPTTSTLHTLSGDIDDHLDAILVDAQGQPMFLFLDPCGTNVSRSRLKDLFAKRRAQSSPPTEVLLNLSAELLRRVSGLLFSPAAASPAAQKSLARLDAMFGGDDWRAVARSARTAHPESFEYTADALADRYFRTLCADTSMGGAMTPVRRKPGDQPIFYLVFLTRSPVGLWHINDAMAKALNSWRAEVDEGTLFSLGDYRKDAEARIQDECVPTIRRNILDVVAARPSMNRVADAAGDILSDVEFIAEEKTVRRVIKELEKAGSLQVVRAKSLHNWSISLRPDAARGH